MVYAAVMVGRGVWWPTSACLSAITPVMNHAAGTNEGVEGGGGGDAVPADLKLATKIATEKVAAAAAGSRHSVSLLQPQSTWNPLRNTNNPRE